MAKEMVSMEVVRECFDAEIKHLETMCKDWESNVDNVIESYCRADKIRSDTPLTNICNIIGHAGQIKAYKTAIESLKTVLGFIDRG